MLLHMQIRQRPVLIDEDKIEKMAEDEKYRSQYEGLISNAAANLNRMQSGLSQNSGVTSYGIKINDNGTASYFAVIDKSLVAQKERIAKNAEKKAEEKKAAAKKDKEEKSEKLKDKKTEDSTKGDSVTVTASSVEELLKKINDIYYETLSDNVMTEDEKKVGQHFDMNV